MSQAVFLYHNMANQCSLSFVCRVKTAECIMNKLKTNRYVIYNNIVVYL